MSLPTNRIKKIKIPNGSGHTEYEIIPEKVSDGSGNYASLPNLSSDATLATEDYVQANPATTTETLTGIKIGNTSYVISGGSDLTNDRYVRYDINSQGLTDTQKSNARTNIGAGTGNVTGSSLTSGDIITGAGGSAIAASAKKVGTSSTTWDNTSDVYVPTMKAISKKKLDKITYEWNKSANFGSSGFLKIGSFPMYDTNVTIDIDATTSKTYHGTVVIATQNTTTSSLGSVHKAEVYDDPSGIIASSLRIVWTSGSRNFDVYFVPQAWSKNLIHIRATGLNSAPDESTICVSQTGTVPTTTEGITITNLLGAASKKSVDTSIAAGSTSANLPTSAAVASFVEGKGYGTGTVTSVDSVSPSSGNVSLSAVRYVSQSLTDAQKTQARSNIGAGTSSFSGSYNDLSNKPTIPDDSNLVHKTGTETITGEKKLTAPLTITNGILPESNSSGYLGTNSKRFFLAYINNLYNTKVNSNVNNFGLTYPDTTGWSNDKIIATTDQVNFKNIPAPASSTLTADELTLFVNNVCVLTEDWTIGSFTYPAGTQFSKPFSYNNTYRGVAYYSNKIKTFLINTDTNVFTPNGANDIVIQGIANLEGDRISPAYVNSEWHLSNKWAPGVPNQDQDLGDSGTHKWNNLFLKGFIGNNNANYGYVLSDTTNFTENKTLAITDDITSAINNLSASSVGQAGSYLKTISESAGVITASAESFDTQIDNSSDNTNAPTSLAVKEFVNSSIATNTANFLGTYNVVTDLSLTTSATHSEIATAIATKLASLSITPTNNDYVFVAYPDATVSTEYTQFDRYKYSSSDSSWGYEYTLNNSTFTAAQWAAINSGITASTVSKLVLTEGNQTIGGVKTFTDNVIISNTSSYPYLRLINAYGNHDIEAFGYDTRIKNNLFIIGSIVPNNTDNYSLGSSTLKWKNLYLAGKVNPNSNSKGLLFPDTSSFTEDKTLVTEDRVNEFASNKADKVSSATNGHLAGLDSNGNLTDSGLVSSNVAVKNADNNFIAAQTMPGLNTPFIAIGNYTVAEFEHDNGIGPTVNLLGHLVVYGDEDIGGTDKPTDQTGFNDLDTDFYNTGITLRGDSTYKLSFPAKSGVFATVDDTLIPIEDLTSI